MGGGVRPRVPRHAARAHRRSCALRIVTAWPSALTDGTACGRRSVQRRGEGHVQRVGKVKQWHGGYASWCSVCSALGTSRLADDALVLRRPVACLRGGRLLAADTEVYAGWGDRRPATDFNRALNSIVFRLAARRGRVSSPRGPHRLAQRRGFARHIQVYTVRVAYGLRIASLRGRVPT